jgi:hypothetical protein
MQDIQLGMLVALIPFFTDSPSNSSSGSLFWFLQIIQVTVAFPLLIIVARGVTTKLLEKFYGYLEMCYFFYESPPSANLPQTSSL